jgi:hypothetical protein
MHQHPSHPPSLNQGGSILQVGAQGDGDDLKRQGRQVNEWGYCTYGI